MFPLLGRPQTRRQGLGPRSGTAQLAQRVSPAPVPQSASQKDSKWWWVGGEGAGRREAGRRAEEFTSPISLSTLPHTDTSPSPSPPPIPPRRTAPGAVPPHPGPSPTAPPLPREATKPRPKYCGAEGAQAWEPRVSLPVTWTYRRPLMASASPGAPPGVGTRRRPPTLRTGRVLTCEGLRGTLPHLSNPSSPAWPAQSARAGVDPKASFLFWDPNARPCLTGLPPSRRRDSPSPCPGAAGARASSRWRRSGRARRGARRRPPGGRGRAAAAPGRGVQTGRGRHRNH